MSRVYKTFHLVVTTESAYSVIIRFRAEEERRLRSPGHVIADVRAEARSCGLPGATRIPASSPITDGIAPTSVDTTAQPAAMASSKNIGKASSREGNTATADDSSARWITSPCV